jgi:hypothetical protein
MRKWYFFIMLFGAAFAVNAQSKPAWVDKPSAVYPERLYVSAVGYGADRQSAEHNAVGSLTAFFRQSVSAKTSITDRETQINGKSVTASVMSQTIEADAALDSLIGAEIKAVWNGNRQWYAVAVMEKAKCREQYAAELDKALREIDTLTDLSGGVTFETIARCKKAQKRAEDAGVYALVLSMLDGPNRSTEASRLASQADAALNEAKAIPIDVRVSGDTGGRIRAAFTDIFTSAGFKTGSRNSRYALEVTLTAAPAPKTVFFNTRYTLDAVLKDTQNGTELFTYNAASRESHPSSQEDADNRMIIGVQRRIADEFPKILQTYLDS